MRTDKRTQTWVGFYSWTALIPLLSTFLALGSTIAFAEKSRLGLSGGKTELVLTVSKATLGIVYGDISTTATQCEKAYFRKKEDGETSGSIDGSNLGPTKGFLCDKSSPHSVSFGTDDIAKIKELSNGEVTVVIQYKDSNNIAYFLSYVGKLTVVDETGSQPLQDSNGDRRNALSPSCDDSVSPGQQVDDVCDQSKELSPFFVRCQNPPGFKEHLVVCVDAFNQGDTPMLSGLPANAGQVLPPNRPILVMVRHHSDRTVTINLTGSRGLYRPGTQNLVPVAHGAESGSRPPAAPRGGAIISQRAFAPRTPDPIDLTVKVFKDEGGGPTPVNQEVIEFIVEQTYGAAIRLGISVVGGNAVDREFEVRSLMSGQSAIAEKSFGNINAELVLGFAPFIDFFRGGRGYSNWRNLTRFPFGISPYVGLGIVNAGQNSLEVFKSVYLGAEWEISGNFSVAVTWVGRRVTRLADGYMVGSTPPGDAVPTVTGFDYGWGIVLNLSPDFFRIAQKSGSSFFGR